ncbi:hypothetical protein E1162_18620 [Rhodobacteraceae bacterium RKSG542]|uniref:hypothetical protein n=1 Tax=Pseudovibrio flavus TaxID=2529854 RepID=UPI0012BBDE11|nr:hypothetical protein [Pseudovibrio flavus]MTI19260.1 hypothetical protein [Pseudovibrio flavus]
MSISGIMGSRSYMLELIQNKQDKLETKSMQLASGRVAETYAGVGPQRATSLSIRTEISAIDSYQRSVNLSSTQLDAMTKTLERMDELRTEAVGAIDPNTYLVGSNGHTTSQAAAKVHMLEVISLLNTDVAGYYLFGGGDANANPVAPIDTILEGEDGKMGLKDTMAAYSAAHLGADGLGRLETATTSDAVSASLTLSEDMVGAFGLSLVGATTTSASGTAVFAAEDAVSDPLNPVPASIVTSLSALPAAGDTFTYEVALPDGTTRSIELTAQASEGGEAGSFVVSQNADPATAFNETISAMEAALKAELSVLSQTELRAYSDDVAGQEFFGTYEDGRIPDAPRLPDAAGTGYVDASSELAQWYTGSPDSGNVRQEKIALVDNGLKVEYGASALEKPFAELLQTMAVYVAADFTPTDPSDPQSLAIAESYYNTLSTATDSFLSVEGDRQSDIQAVTVEMSLTYSAVMNADSRLEQKSLTYSNMLGEIEGVDKTELAAEISFLQTNLEASYQATSMLLNMSIANYLK